MDMITRLIFLLCCLVCVILTAVLFKIRREIYRASGVSIGYFLILPKKVLLIIFHTDIFSLIFYCYHYKLLNLCVIYPIQYVCQN
jgi:hypothetical protein